MNWNGSADCWWQEEAAGWKPIQARLTLQSGGTVTVVPRSAGDDGTSWWRYWPQPDGDTDGGDNESVGTTRRRRRQSGGCFWKTEASGSKETRRNREKLTTPSSAGGNHWTAHQACPPWTHLVRQWVQGRHACPPSQDSGEFSPAFASLGTLSRGKISP